MKMIILPLVAFFGVTAALAQSYPKQPDPSVYEVVYYKPAQTQVKEQPKETQPAAIQAEPNTDRKTERTSSDIKSSTSAVAVNEDKTVKKQK